MIIANSMHGHTANLVGQVKGYLGWFLTVALFVIISQPISAYADYTWPVDAPNWSNGFADYNKVSNQKYHTGIDLSGIRKTTVKAAQSGTVVKIIGLAPDGGGSERVYTWNDINNDNVYDIGEESGPLFTGRSNDNHGMGITVVIAHNDGKYSLYAHLDAVDVNLYQQVVINQQPVTVTQGEAIALMGFSTDNSRSSSNIHLHFEVKDTPSIGNVSDDYQYWGYTPDTPIAYGYSDPQTYITPNTSSAITPVTIRITDGDSQGYLKVRAGPGTGYARIARVKVGAKFVAFEQASIVGETWYQVDLPNLNGPATGWIAGVNPACVNNACSIEDASDYIRITDNTVKVRVGPGTSEGKLQHYDTTYNQYRDVQVWAGQRFAMASGLVSGVDVPGNICSSGNWYGIHLPTDLSPTDNPYVPMPAAQVGYVCSDYTVSQAAGSSGGIDSVKVVAGYYHTVALKGDGTVLAWGYNPYGLLGDGTNSGHMTPAPVKDTAGNPITGITNIEAGYLHTVALRGDGSLLVWGRNDYGQLGDGTTTDRWNPVPVRDAAGNPITSITNIVAYNHTVALRGDGSLLAWGRNDYGQLGDGTTTDRWNPVPVRDAAGNPVTGISSIAAGYRYTVALKSDGTLLIWGNGYGANPVQIRDAAGNPITGITSIAARYNHTIALRGDGSLLAWGANSFGQLGDGTNNGRQNPEQVKDATGNPITGITSIAAGYYHTVALKDDGAVLAWGHNLWGQLGDGTTTSRLNPVPVVDAASKPTTGITGIAAGSFHTVALKGDGAVLAWGNNPYGQLGDGTATNRLNPVPVKADVDYPIAGITNIEAGYLYTVALRGDETLLAWGRNDYGQLGDGTTNDRWNPLPVKDTAGNPITGITGIAAKVSHTVALKGDGTLLAWGGNDNGQLGDGTVTNRLNPVPVKDTAGNSITGITGMVAGDYYTVALKGDGTLLAWGRNDNGQLGDGTTIDRWNPVPVKDTGGNPITGITSIAAGYRHTVALKGDGTLLAWGDNYAGPLGDGTNIDRRNPVPVIDAAGNPITGITSIAAGYRHTVALKGDGTLLAWGDNYDGQLGDGTNIGPRNPVPVIDAAGNPITGITSIAAGDRHTVALKEDGTLLAWGRNDYGELGDGTNIDRRNPVPVKNTAGNSITGITGIAAGYYHNVALKGDGTLLAWGRNYAGPLGDGTTIDRWNPVAVLEFTPLRLYSVNPLLSVSGSITESAGSSLNNTTLSLSGSATQSTISASDGGYSFAGLVAGSYDLTPTLSGYTFDPVSRSVVLTSYGVAGQNFRACQTGTAYTGSLKDTNGNPIQNAQVTIGGNTVTVDANGNYSVTGLSCGSHALSVTPINGATFKAFNGNVDTFSAWSLDLQLADEATTFGLDSPSGKAGDPVDTATGNYIYQRRDMNIPGIGMPFTFDRSYNSRDDGSGSLGFNWTHNWNISLDDSTGSIEIRWGDGRAQLWSPDGVGGFTPPSGTFDTLIDNGNGTYTLRKKNLTEYHFDTSGRLSAIEDKNGNTTSLTYTGNNITQITDSAGRNIDFSYDANNRITLITDPISRTTQFGYDLNGDLTTATDANGNITTYTYDANHQILTVVDPQGNTLVSNSYDALDRVVTYQTDAKGGETTYVYDSNESKTTITDALGYTTVHYHDSMLRLIREEDGNGGIALYEYDAAGNRSKVTDKNGNPTLYGYDTYGNVTSKTDALGNITTITYDAQNNPLSRTDALGYVTQFTYDANGNLIQTTDALGNITSVSYSSEGQPQTFTDGLGNVTTHAYDAEGNQVQTTDALANVVTNTYDGVGRRLSTTDSLGRITAYTYDANDNLLTITDPLGNTITHSYDGNNNRLSTLDRNGNLTLFSYDQKDLLTTTTDALGNVETNTYDALDRRVTVTDANGNVTQLNYDAVGNQIQLMDALGNITQYTYDPNGNRLSSTDARGYTTSFQYDALNRRVQFTDPLGQSTSTTYDVLGQVVTTTSAIGQVTTNTYDALGRIVQVTNALGGIILHGYDANGNRISTTDSRGNTTAYGYDALNRRVNVTDALGQSATTTYDAAGQVSSVTDKRGNSTSSEYDAAGRLIQVTDALGNVTQQSYDANGNRLTKTDALGRVISMAYDTIDRVVSRTDAAGAVATINYDAVGNMTSETDRNGNATLYAYDSVHRRTQVTDALGHAMQFGYDAVGNQISQTDALGYVTTTSYDAKNRPVTTTDALGNATISVYDAVGRMISNTDAKGQVTTYNYDGLNRLLQVTDAQGGVVNYSYDANGNRLTMTDPNGNATSYSYDVLNRQITTTEALGNITTMQYDAVGNVTQRIDARGQVTAYTYDPLNRLVLTTYSGPKTVALSYDAVGNRTQMTDSLGATNTSFDVRNRITQLTDPFGMVVQYGYDDHGNRTSLTYPGNKVVSYGYDARNRLITVTDWLNQATNYQYDAAGRLTLTTLPNGTRANYSYDSANRLTSLMNQKSDASVISSYVYTLDNVGNHLSEDRVEPINPVLLAETQMHSFDAENRLTDTNVIANSFDANGNLTIKASNGYAYDEENRLTQTTIAAETTNYTYDGMGNRYSRTRAGTTTRFVLDTNTALTNVLAETDTSGTVQSYNVYGLGLIASIQPDNTTYYYHYDSRGSTVALTDSSETITDSYAYDPFGKPIAANGPNTNSFRYLGRYGVLDEGGDLNYIRARYYDTEQQRFVSKDSYLGENRQTQTLNRYIYSVNSPLVTIDVSGYFGLKEFGQGVRTWGVGVTQFGFGIGKVGLAVFSGASGAAKSALTWNPIYITSGYVSGLDKLNEGSRSILAGMNNIILRAPRMEETMKISDAKGALDPLFENKTVTMVRDVNKLYGLFTTLNSFATNGPGSLEELYDSVTKYKELASFSTEAIALTQFLDSFGEVENTYEVVSLLYDAINDAESALADRLPFLVDEKCSTEVSLNCSSNEYMKAQTTTKVMSLNSPIIPEQLEVKYQNTMRTDK